MSDKPIWQQKTVWLGVIPLVICSLAQALAQAGIITQDIANVVAFIFGPAGIAGGLFGIRQSK